MGTTAILSHIVIDEIRTPASEEPVVEVGGAGAYAAVGASLAGSPGSSALVAGIGRDDQESLSAWCRDREIDPAGLFVVSEASPRTRIEYFADGERVETPVYGLEHFHAHTPLPRHIPYEPDRIAAVYLFHAHEDAYWAEVADYRPAFGGPLLWEISSDSCLPEHLATVRERLAFVDVLSLNRTEALSLFGVATVDEVTRLLGGLGIPVLLRLGSEGSLVIDGDDVHRVSPVTVTVADPTGGGNSYSGAFLASYASSGDLGAAASVAAAAASLVISQPGAPLVSDRARSWVAEAARSNPATSIR
ncbi:carbohydrate kinase family protein [Leifsonia poae]|uniref:carbohydrate kinase family protein n=1 Tax=Leifsonia poae TaxID=110933 RepID=UPI001CBC9CA0|nr:carbohydrate kinase family protein [Leifsonia poae]